MNRYVEIISAYLWSFLGDGAAFGGYKDSPFYRAHADDLKIAPFHNSLISKSTVRKLASYHEDTLISQKAYAPPYDLELRNITSWITPNLTIGGELFN